MLGKFLKKNFTKLVWNAEGKRQHGRPTHKWNNIKIFISETWCENDEIKLWAIVKIIKIMI